MRCSRGLAVTKKIFLGTFVCSNRLYKLRRWFPGSFRKIWFFFFTLLMCSTWPETLISCIYTYFSDFVPCWWCSPVLKKILLETFMCSIQLYALRRSFPKSVRKILFCFLTFLMGSTWPQHGPLSALSHCSAGRCSGPPLTQNKKYYFSETFRKWSPECVELIRAHERLQKYVLQHRRIPPTWNKVTNRRIYTWY